MGEDGKRKIGRPDQQASEQVVQHILETASRLFTDQGYAATSIEQIAAAAGSGKQTIYRRFTSKEGLFLAVVDDKCRRIEEVATAAQSKASDPLDVLKEACWFLLNLALTDETIGFFRVLSSEVRLFPDLAEYALSRGGIPTDTLLASLFDAAMADRKLSAQDAKYLLPILLGMLIGWPMQKALLGEQILPDAASRHAYFETAWNHFLKMSSP
jgi:AcrR family transcriptional regulator